ncbi:OmpA family protein [Paracoccus sp. C2R09]|nr:hypothetical protein [Paracoccus sp. C2R09]MBU2956803.1 hypothetical protein [Paracoccus sp. C2R09]
MGLTVAEAFILLSFVLLLLFTWWQVDTEKRSLRLPDGLVEMTAEQKSEILSRLIDGTFELAKALHEAGLGPQDQAAVENTSNYAHFMRDEDLKRLLSNAVELSPDTRLQLSDAVEITPEAELIHALESLSDGTFDLAKALRGAGLDPQDQAAIKDAMNYSRFMREEDLKRLMAGAVELPPGTRLKLSEVVEITPETRLRVALDDLLKPEEAVATASQRLAEAARAEEGLVAMLERELGASIRAAGGELRADGTIILPQNVLFDGGSDRIKDPAFLKDFCSPWVSTLKSSELDISELKIEGHASSEGQPGQNASQAYLYNLSLSQHRAQNALEVCLGGLADPAILDWARGRLSSTGYSSARLVMDDSGIEDREASRRVEFSMEMNREKLLNEISEDLRGEAVRF